MACGPLASDSVCADLVIAVEILDTTVAAEKSILFWSLKGYNLSIARLSLAVLYRKALSWPCTPRQQVCTVPVNGQQTGTHKQKQRMQQGDMS